MFRPPYSKTLRVCPKCLKRTFISSLHQNMLYDTCFLCGTKLVNTELTYENMNCAYDLSKWNVLDLFNIKDDIIDILTSIPYYDPE